MFNNQLRPKSKSKIKPLLALFAIILVVFACLTAFFLILALNDTKSIISASKQDLDSAKSSIKSAQNNFKNAQKTLLVFTPFRIIPIVGWYIADVQRGVSAAASTMQAASTLAQAITPYADVIGLKGQTPFLGGTAQERLASTVEALSKVTPQLDDVSNNLSLARKQLDQVQSWRYPNFLPGKPGDKVKIAKETIDQVDTFLKEAKPLIAVLPQIMGQQSDKKYLILFQNDAELRPTGGFITGYGYIKVSKGKIESQGSQDIYKLDSTLAKTFPAPEPIIKYLPNVYNLNIRDSNLSPDFFASMKQFEKLYAQTSADQNIDGIIALDTQFVLKMIEVLGPQEASGSKFTQDKVDSCACPQIIYELEKYADQPVNFEKGDRKEILGILMQKMMAATFAAPKSKWPQLINTVLASLQQKHLLLYFRDQTAQDAANKINFSGRIYEYDGDYFHINDTNFGGAKSNLYVTQKVTQTIKKDKSGKINKTVTIEYKYPRDMDNCSLERTGGLCLAGIYRDWLRIYVPKGSTLVKSSGLEQALTASEDLNKTVFEGFFTLRPRGIAKIEFEYTIPVNYSKTYKLLIQKQPGTIGNEYEIDAFGKKQKAFPLNFDKELVVGL